MKHLDDIYEKLINAFDNEELKHIVKHDTFIAGGFLRDLHFNKTPKDIDIFFKNEKAARRFNEIVTEGLNQKLKFTDMNKMRVQTALHYNNCSILSWLYWSNNALSFHHVEIPYPVQFVIKRIGHPKTVISTFDFHVNMFYYNPVNNELYNPTIDFPILGPMNQPKLTINSDCNRSSILLDRVLKFHKNGYAIPRETMLKVVEIVSQCSQEDKDDYLKGATYYG